MSYKPCTTWANGVHPRGVFFGDDEEPSKDVTANTLIHRYLTRKGRATGREIADAIGLINSSVASSLSLMREAGIVESEVVVCGPGSRTTTYFTLKNGGLQ